MSSILCHNAMLAVIYLNTESKLFPISLSNVTNEYNFSSSFMHQVAFSCFIEHMISYKVIVHIQEYSQYIL